MTTDKIQGQHRILAYVLKACFTKSELASLRASGATITQVLDGGYYDDVTRANSQKFTLSIMSRWGFDDDADMLQVYGAAAAGYITKREWLGRGNSDGLFENLGDAAQGVVSKVTDVLTRLAGGSFSQRQVIGLDGTISSGDEISVETGEPVYSFADPATAAVFCRNHGVDGTGQWRDI
jgi:hypothetical protein